MAEIIVKIDEGPGEKLKVTWLQGRGAFEPYSIDMGQVIRISKNLRDSLQHLINATMQDRRASCGGLLKDLALRGHDLFDTLLPHAEAVARDVKDWLVTDMAGERHTVCFNVPPRAHVPWGLVFDVDPDLLSGDPAATGIDLYRNFWCLKYSLSALYYKIKPRGMQPRRASSFVVLPALNQTTLAAVCAQYADEEKAHLQRYFPGRWQPVYKKAEVFDAWKAKRNEIDMLYFYCHADGTKLALGQDVISIDDFHLRLTRDEATPNNPPCIVFLNGCDTAIGDLHGGFLEATGGPGYCGFIGTEAQIPDYFALKFGLEFFDEFVEKGCSLAEAIDALRERHWPMSLIFSICCPSTISVVNDIRTTA